VKHVLIKILRQLLKALGFLNWFKWLPNKKRKKRGHTNTIEFDFRKRILDFKHYKHHTDTFLSRSKC
jgi:hypothetical protein